jgi:hypothetical protein
VENDQSNFYPDDIIKEINHTRVAMTDGNKLRAAERAGYEEIPSKEVCNHHVAYALVVNMLTRRFLGASIGNTLSTIYKHMGFAMPRSERRYERGRVGELIDSYMDAVANHPDNLFYGTGTGDKGGTALDFPTQNPNRPTNNENDMAAKRYRVGLADMFIDAPNGLTREELVIWMKMHSQNKTKANDTKDLDVLDATTGMDDKYKEYRRTRGEDIALAYLELKVTGGKDPGSGAGTFTPKTKAQIKEAGKDILTRKIGLTQVNTPVFTIGATQEDMEEEELDARVALEEENKSVIKHYEEMEEEGKKKIDDKTKKVIAKRKDLATAHEWYGWIKKNTNKRIQKARESVREKRIQDKLPAPPMRFK